MDGRVRIVCDDLVHEIEELDPAPPILVRSRDLACGYLEGGKQGRGPVALVVMAVAGELSAVRELQISPRTLQRLDRGLSSTPEANRFSRRGPVRPGPSAALAANSG